MDLTTTRFHLRRRRRSGRIYPRYKFNGYGFGIVHDVFPGVTPEPIPIYLAFLEVMRRSVDLSSGSCEDLCW